MVVEPVLLRHAARWHYWKSAPTRSKQNTNGNIQDNNNSCSLYCLLLHINVHRAKNCFEND